MGLWSTGFLERMEEMGFYKKPEMDNINEKYEKLQDFTRFIVMELGNEVDEKFRNNEEFHKRMITDGIEHGIMEKCSNGMYALVSDKRYPRHI